MRGFVTEHREERTRPSGVTRRVERDQADTGHVADAEPTPEEDAAADRAPDLDPEVAEHAHDMYARGAAQQGEGRIP